MSASIGAFVSNNRPWIELARLNKPAGALLMIWPYVWGLAMAARSVNLPLLSFLKHLVAGSLWFMFVRRQGDKSSAPGAGCIWNDIIDRDLDRRVERTKHRPLASGRVSVAGALIFLFLHLVPLSSFLVLGNGPMRLIGLLTLYPLAGGYPFMKRISYWPQAWLGIAFNTGTVMSWAAISGSIPYSGILLAAAAWFWTMWYDTIYGSQDKKDDVKIGIKSTALLFKSSNTTRFFLVFHALMFIGCLTLAGVMNSQGLPYYFISIFISAVNLATDFWSLDLNSPKSCATVFSNSGYILGPVVSLGLLTDYLYQKSYY